MTLENKLLLSTEVIIATATQPRSWVAYKCRLPYCSRNLWRFKHAGITQNERRTEHRSFIWSWNKRTNTNVPIHSWGSNYDQVSDDWGNLQCTTSLPQLNFRALHQGKDKCLHISRPRSSFRRLLYGTTVLHFHMQAAINNTPNHTYLFPSFLPSR
jgi:hypothetical protein